MALQQGSSMRGVAAGLAAVLGCAGALGCASVLGIEDATCDPDFDTACSTTVTASNLPAPGGAAGSGGDAAVAGSAGVSSNAGAGAGGTAAGAGAPSAGASNAGGAGASSAGASSAGASGAGAAGAEPVEEEPLCDRYCSAVATACTGTNEQYASLDACLAVCSQLEPGSPGDFTGNTIECRLARAQLAQRTGEANNYCYSAGPGGAGVCGDDCEGFCALMAQTCPAAMGSYGECLPQCEAVPNLSGPPENVTYNTTVQDGNSVQCRLFHVTAATLDPIAHCVHAAGLAPCAVAAAEPAP